VARSDRARPVAPDAAEATRADVTARRARRLAAPLGLLALGVQVSALLLMIPNSASYGIPSLGFNGVGGVVLGLTYPVLGWLVTSRRPENPIGWLFLAIGLSQATTSFVSQYTLFVYTVQPSAPFGDIASWMGMWTWVPGYVLLFVVILLFPDGSLPSRRWRPVLWLAALAMGLSVGAQAVGSWSYRGPVLLSPDFTPDPTGSPLVAVCLALVNIGQTLVLPVAVGALAGMVVRFRHSGPLERLQIRWFALAAVVEVALLLATSYVQLRFPIDEITALLVVPLVPIATAVAILRYRLYELDRIISRTLAWALVTAVIVTVFGLGVVGLQAILAGVTQGQTLAVAASTLLAFALFQPVRRRVQAAVDRRFNRARYDAERTAAAFAGRLRGEVALEAVEADLMATAQRSMDPRGTGLWLREAQP
jgi:hypothetical protein